MTQPDRPRGPFAPGRVFALIAGAAGVVAIALVVGLRTAPEPAAEPPVPALRPAAPGPAADAPATRGLGAQQGYQAQSYSAYCQTSQGTCTLPTALPIGSPCDCGGVPGQIVP
jgi:hypothetical protein